MRTALACATHVVRDARAAAARFGEWLDYAVAEEGVIDEGLAAAWRTPATAGRRYTLCRPASGAESFVRFVEGDAVAGFAPLRSFGWAAIELCVQDVLAVNARLAGSPFEIVGQPKANPGLPTIHPMQVRGPDGEFVYLTQILTDDPASGLPRAASPIDRPFILVLACADLAATARWFVETLRLDVAPPIAIPYSMLARSFGLPPDQLHMITTARDAGEIIVELDQYPAAATPRDRRPGALPPGLAVCTLALPRIDRIAGWAVEPAIRSGMLYAGRRVGVVCTPEGALIEIIDRAEAD